MTSIVLTSDAFPTLMGTIRAHWAPIFLSPIEGAFERLVIGVAVVDQSGFVIEQANALERLRCLYGDNAEAAIFAAVVALEQLNNEFASKGFGAFSDVSFHISGVEIGPVHDTEGRSLREIATSWMKATSSLYRHDVFTGDAEDEGTAEALGVGGDGVDRLPRLVMDYVLRQDVAFSSFFRQDLIGAQRRRRSHEVTIDFAGSRLVANFGALQPGSITKSVDHIKRRLWDLKVDRDKDAGAFLSRHHELIVQMPSPHDPIFTDRQHAALKEAHRALEEQADQEQLRLRPLPTVQDIGQRVILAESGQIA